MNALMAACVRRDRHRELPAFCIRTLNTAVTQPCRFICDILVHKFKRVSQVLRAVTARLGIIARCNGLPACHGVAAP